MLRCKASLRVRSAVRLRPRYWKSGYCLRRKGLRSVPRCSHIISGLAQSKEPNTEVEDVCEHGFLGGFGHGIEYQLSRARL